MPAEDDNDFPAEETAEEPVRPPVTFIHDEDEEIEPVDPEELRELRLRRLRLAPAFLPVVLAAALFFIPRSAGPAQSLLLAGIFVAGLGIVALALRFVPELSRERLVALGVAAVPAVLMSLASLQATNRAVSYLGTAGQHAGALLWLACWSVFAVTLLLGNRRTLLAITRVIALIGALFTVTAGLQAIGVMGGAPGWGFASAPLENSNSLGAMLVLSLGCALAWAFASRGAEQVAAWGATAAVLVGLIPARSSGAWVAVLAGAAFLGMLAIVKRFDRSAAIAAVSWVAIVVLATGTLALAATGGLGAPLADLTDTAGNMRGKLWRSSVAAIAADPLTGRGPEQFTAWVTWNADGAQVNTQGALDPHNALFAAAIAAGLPGALVVLAVGGWLLFALVRGTERAGSPLALRFILAALVAWAAALGFSWIAPYPALAASLLAGGLLAACPTDPAPAARPRAYLGAALAAGAIVAISATVPVVLEVNWYSDLALGRFIAPLGTDLHETYPDPGFIVAAEQELMRRAATEQDSAKAAEFAKRARALSKRAEADRVWNVDLAFDAMSLSTKRFGAADEKTYAAALAAGQTADRASGLWLFAASRHAQAAGQDAEALRLARAALAFKDLPGNIRAQLQSETR